MEMAKRDPKHPALRGYQVWRWLKRGILEAKPLEGTPILVVHKSARVRLNHRFRTTLGQGIFLVPRWIPAPQYELEKFSHLSAKELEALGFIKKEGKSYLLIYQQVEDLPHLYRQQEHILFDGIRTQAFDLGIKPFIIGRREVAAALEKQRAKQLQRIRVLQLVPLLGRLGFPKMPIPNWELEGIIRYLDGIITELDGIIERPLVPRRKRVQESLRATQRQLRKRNFYRARKRLEKAIENLAWPLS